MCWGAGEGGWVGEQAGAREGEERGGGQAVYV